MNFGAQVLDTADPADRRTIDRLRSDPRVASIDRVDLQWASLRRLIPAPGTGLLDEPTRWVHYPWRRALVHLLGPQAFRRLRLDRNRHLITAGEQDRLQSLRIGVVGLSVGNVIAHTLAAEALCGGLRLADFDELELSNLNRVPATVFDLGENKAAVAAQRIAELDPYLDVEVWSGGLTPETLDLFLDGLHVVVEECDSLDMKALLRRTARARRLPVLMATSDRGMVDVERFDLEPDRPILHGLLGETDIDRLATLSAQEKIPHVLRIVDAAQGSARAAASLLEVGQSLSTWPQLAGEAALGATAVAEAVRRIGLDEPLHSGRARVDVGDALDGLTDPTPLRLSPERLPDHAIPGTTPTGDAARMVAEAAARAPSGGNAQPWHIEYDHQSITVRVAAEHPATVDIDYRSSAVAVGAAVFNARVAAAAHGMLGAVDWSTKGTAAPLSAVMRFSDGADAELAGLYPLLLRRETNRHPGSGKPLHSEAADVLESVAGKHDARLRLLQEPHELNRAADLLARSDRVRFLSPRLHAEMRSEVRWPDDDAPDTGIELNSLELAPAERAALDILRRSDVMAHLAAWNAGGTLGESTRTRILSSSALGVLTVTGDSLLDYARGGMAAEAVWIAATEIDLAVHPTSPLFLHARTREERSALSESWASELDSLAAEFDELLGLEPDEATVVVFRFGYAPPTSVRSRRRPVRRAEAPTGRTERS